MINWQKFPFVRFTIAFIVGICSFLIFTNNIKTVGLLLTINVLTYLILFLIQRKKYKNQLKTPLGIVALFILILLGNATTYLQTETNHQHHISNFSGNIKAYEGVVLEPLIEKNKSYKTRYSI